MASIRVIISGRVQGVSYRAWTVAAASELGLKGWVRNLSDGRVEAVFSGEQKTIDVMVEKCRQGPPAARVTSIETFNHTETAEERFTAKPTI